MRLTDEQIEAKLAAHDSPPVQDAGGAAAPTSDPAQVSEPAKEPSAQSQIARKVKVKADDDTERELDLDNPKDVEILTREYGSRRRAQQAMKEATAIQAERDALKAELEKAKNPKSTPLFGDDPMQEIRERLEKAEAFVNETKAEREARLKEERTNTVITKLDKLVSAEAYKELADDDAKETVLARARDARDAWLEENEGDPEAVEPTIDEYLKMGADQELAYQAKIAARVKASVTPPPKPAAKVGGTTVSNTTTTTTKTPETREQRERRIDALIEARLASHA